MKDDASFDLSEMERKERWKYYTSSYVRIEPTEGVPMSRVRKPLLTRNLIAAETDSETGSVSASALNTRKPLYFEEELSLRLCVNTLRLTYTPGTSEYFIYDSGEKGKDAEAAKRAKENRTNRFREKFELNPKWAKGVSQQKVQDRNEEFTNRWKESDATAEVAA
jgi:paired amphipathic helix protein Sin3a